MKIVLLDKFKYYLWTLFYIFYAGAVICWYNWYNARGHYSKMG
jgi:hypothetical protein